jgi:hypothetical protein
MVSDPMVRSAQNRVTILHQQKHHVQTDQKEIPHDARHLGVPLGASKTISEPMVRSAQTVHQSSTVSKQIKTRFDMTHVT